MINVQLSMIVLRNLPQVDEQKMTTEVKKVNNNGSSPQNCIDYDIHGLVGIRLINPSPEDAKAVAKQLGPMQSHLTRDADITIRFIRKLFTPDLKYLGVNMAGFNEDGFYVLFNKKAKTKVRIPFEQIGRPCEIVCESGLQAVPLLIPILNLTLIAKDCIALHASAFFYNQMGVLVTGWSKGGKTEALLAFANQGAKYIGDEWIIMTADGEKMYGLPEPIRVWDWHLEYLPQVRRRIKISTLLLFAAIHGLDKMYRLFKDGILGKTRLVKTLAQAMPALKRQLGVNIAPEVIFGKGFSQNSAKSDKIFFIMSQEAPDIHVELCDPIEIARRIAHSIQYEQLPFMQYYHAFRFAFPDVRNPFIEKVAELQYDILCRALLGKEAYLVRRPYPVAFDELYQSMQPFCKYKIQDSFIEELQAA